MRTESRSASLPVALSFMLCTLAAPRFAAAEWPVFGRAVCAEPGDQVSPSITTDGQDGAIIAWADGRSQPGNIVAMRVLASGNLDAAWPAGGRALRTDPLALAGEPAGPALPAAVPDGAGGAIVVWEDHRSTTLDIYAQHVLASGAVDGGWPANGAALSVIAGSQEFPTIVPDGTGGAIVAWMDTRPGTSALDVYAQHVLASGLVDPRWPANGLPVATAPNPQALPTLAEDGAGGAIVTWFDGRSTTTGFDIYAQHLLNSGIADPAWPPQGRALCTAVGDQFEPKIVSDGAHGAIVTWYDSRNSASSRVFAEHVLASGIVDPAWPVDGLAVSDGAHTEESPDLTSDGSGGAIVSWHSINNGIRAYAQHLLGGGRVDPAWPANGRPLSVNFPDEFNPVIASDGNGGAIVAWHENTAIVAQHVLASGALDSAYTDLGRPLCSLPSQHGPAGIVEAGPAGAIVTWEDTRSTFGVDIYALQVLDSVVTDVPGSTPPGSLAVRLRPNPARGPLSLQFALPRETRVKLTIYDVSGRRVRELTSGARPAGEHTVTWDLRDQGGHAVAAGLYFARLEAEGRSLTKKIVTLR